MPKIKKDKSCRFVWPKISPSIERAVIKQLHSEISIYDGGGIFSRFEKKFAAYHDRRFAVLCNSGTNAIHSMFVAANLGSGDEVICPAYTFFATVTPLLFTGAKPVLCDCDENGNIDPKEIKKKISSQTRALIVTHMWGIPAQMKQIVAICRRHKILLMEDCSHAHGAEYYGRRVGSFGDLAAWSLQGAKNITGGEGGIMLTNNRNFYERALLLGHYNKRCLKDILPASPWHDYAVTGMGLKYRAHPLAIAVADKIFDNLKLNGFYRQRYAKELLRDLKASPALKLPPAYYDENISPSWYAFIFFLVSGGKNGISSEVFLNKARQLGLSDADMPGSTKPLNLLPLFQRPSALFPGYTGRYSFAYKPGDFPMAEKVYQTLVKVPLGVDREDKRLSDLYRRGLKSILS